MGEDMVNRNPLDERFKAEVAARPVQYWVRLKIEADGLGVLVEDMANLALKGRAGHHEVIAFVYQDPWDPDNPDEVRPLRRARIVVEDLGIVAQQREQS